ncbi:hypothetical protein GEMRC1_012952 [Eukaryota sp. GEM-RC1]
MSRGIDDVDAIIPVFYNPDSNTIVDPIKDDCTHLLGSIRVQIENVKGLCVPTVFNNMRQCFSFETEDETIPYFSLSLLVSCNTHCKDDVAQQLNPRFGREHSHCYLLNNPKFFAKMTMPFQNALSSSYDQYPSPP